MDRDGSGPPTFDFAAFRAAFEEKDVPRWVARYAEDAEWIEYSDATPPAAPRKHRGRGEIRRFLEGVASSPVTLRISDEVLGAERAAFVVTCTLPDARRILEHVIVHHVDGLIVRQVDVEAWDRA